MSEASWDRPHVDVEGIVKAISSQAILLDQGDGDEPAWVPKSQILDYEPNVGDLEIGDKITITIPEWLAEAKELI